MSTDELIQLMRLSGTDKVRTYLTEMRRYADEGDLTATMFLDMLSHMFLLCKRSSIAEAWPSPDETQRPT